MPSYHLLPVPNPEADTMLERALLFHQTGALISSTILFKALILAPSTPDCHKLIAHIFLLASIESYISELQHAIEAMRLSRSLVAQYPEIQGYTQIAQLAKLQFIRFRNDMVSMDVDLEWISEVTVESLLASSTTVPPLSEEWEALLRACKAEIDWNLENDTYVTVQDDNLTSAPVTMNRRNDKMVLALRYIAVTMLSPPY